MLSEEINQEGIFSGEGITITTGIMPEDRIAGYIEKDKTLIIKDPPAHLVELYLMSLIPQFLFIRAEADYSIENKVTNKTLGKFNKNYGELITLIKGAKNIGGFTALITYILQYTSISLNFTKWENYCYSIKHATSLKECLEFMIFKYNIIL